MNSADSKSFASKTDWASLLLYVVCGLIAFYMILPILIVFPMSFSSAEFLTFPQKGKTYPETYDIDAARPFYVTRKIYED